MEDNLNFKVNGKRTNFLINERHYQFVGKWKTTLICWQMKDYINLLANGKQHKFVGK